MQKAKLTVEPTNQFLIVIHINTTKLSVISCNNLFSRFSGISTGDKCWHQQLKSGKFWRCYHEVLF
jgi:hypothetical protein